MNEIKELEDFLKTIKPVFTSPIVTESYKNETKQKLKELIKIAQELLS